MGQIVIWALLTGGITGAAWVGIVLVSRYRRLESERLAMVDELEDRLEKLEDAKDRLAEMEQRLDMTEHLLVQRNNSGALPPGEG